MSPNATEVSNSTRRVLSASTLAGDKVRNAAGEDLGSIEEIMIDLESGSIAYAVVSFGGFLGMGDKLFAVPWSALQLNADEHEFVLDVDKKTLENAPGFDKSNWPDFADSTFGEQVYTYYSQTPNWERLENARRARANDFQAPTAGRDAEVRNERLNQPDLPEELRRRPIDVTKFPGHDADADLRAADPSRTYAVNDTNSWTRK